MQRTLCIRNGLDKTYSYIRKRDKNPQFVDFHFHTHNGYEIFIFIKGDVDFVVEGVTYHLVPYDTVIMNDSEMHQIFHKTNSDYERIVINITDDFFVNQHCEEYRDIFLNRGAGIGNLIKGEMAQESGLIEATERIEKYIKEGNKKNDTIVKCVIVELLHLLNKCNSMSDTQLHQNDFVKEIIDYMNCHLTTALTLDQIADHFFISKYHLCRIFKKATGFTIHRYITNKRILLVRKLHKQGKNLSTACMEAGFGNYSNFYKIYVKETGVSPKKDLR